MRKSLLALLLVAAGGLAQTGLVQAAVQLKEGVSLLGRLVDIPLDRLAVGLPVRFRPFARGNQMAVGFGPA